MFTFSVLSATFLHVYRFRTLVWTAMGQGTDPERCREMAISTPAHKELTVGSQRVIRSSGRTSGMPPTRVLTTFRGKAAEEGCTRCTRRITTHTLVHKCTGHDVTPLNGTVFGVMAFHISMLKSRHTCSPQLAASTMAMQKASVSEVLRKM